MTLSHDVVEQDHRLEKSAESASEALAQHRWHWTLDETNPGRVSVNTYASAIGRNYKTVYALVHGYAAVYGGAPITLTEATERASMSAETEAVVEAVAEATIREGEILKQMAEDGGLAAVSPAPAMQF